MRGEGEGVRGGGWAYSPSAKSAGGGRPRRLARSRMSAERDGVWTRPRAQKSSASVMPRDQRSMGVPKLTPKRTSGARYGRVWTW